MPTKKVYIGSVGPFLYDDSSPLNDPDGDFAGETVKSLTTNGQQLVEQVPTDPYHVMRLDDMPYGNIDANVSDVTASRSKNTVYQNTHAGIMVVQIVVRLSL